MPRRVEDIVRTDKRSVKDAEKPKAAPKKKAQPAASIAEAEREPARPARKRPDGAEEVALHKLRVMPPIPPQDAPARKKKPVGKGAKAWIIAIAAIIILVAAAGYVASAYFSRATFTIVPVTVPVSAQNSTIVALATSTSGYLMYSTIDLRGTATTSIAAADGPYMSTKATGSVTLYNSYSAQPQRLIAGSRLSGSNGLVYRLTSSVVVPGYTVSKGVKSPGTLKATVAADAAGSQYNMTKAEAGTLKFISYMTTARYDTVYAVARTDISGGFVGRKKTIDPSALATTTKRLADELTSSLLAKAKASVPAGYIMYDSAYTVSAGAPQVSDSASNAAAVAVSETLHAVIFKRADLVAKLASAKLGSLAKAPYEATGLDDLSFAITNASTFDPVRGTALIAKLTGPITVRGVVPSEELKQKLAGLPLSETKAVISSYSSVIDVPKSSGELFPSWATAVPSDPSRITIEIDGK